MFGDNSDGVESSFYFGGIKILEDKKLFDMEYMTMLRAEVDYLGSLGIKYTFVKRNNGISQYKYKKTSELFEALRLFYGMKEKI